LIVFAPISSYLIGLIDIECLGTSERLGTRLFEFGFRETSSAEFPSLNDNLLSETFEVGISKLSFPLFVLGV
jgi:hypothetical protein